MVTLEQAERLCARANISYEEAKRILEETNGDLLEAVIRLEKEGKVTPPKNDGSYSTQEEEKSTVNNEQEPERFLTFKEILRNIINWFVKLIRIGNVNYFDVYQNGVKFISVPITILVILLIFAFWIVVPLIILGLFFGFRYQFRGPDIEKTPANKAADSVYKAANTLKNEFVKPKDGTDGKNSDN